MDDERIEMVAEATVQRFFNNYLINVFPEQLEKVITAHNKDVTAHSQQIQDAVKAESGRVTIKVLALVAALALGSGAGLARVIAALAGN